MSEEVKIVKKPFKGVRRTFYFLKYLIVLLTNLQAKVDWPADMPDDMLEDAISVAKKALEEHDFEE